MRKFLYISVILTGLSFLPTSFAATQLAKINGKVITLEDFNKKFDENKKFFRYKTPTKKNILEDMIKRELAIQEAKKLGLNKDPEVIERMNTVLYHSLLDKKLAKKFDAIQISDSEVRSFYRKNPEIRTSHIFVQVRFDATDAQEKAAKAKINRIHKIMKEALKGGKQTFAEVARTYSEGVAAAAGGDIDYQTKDKLDPKYYRTAVGLRKIGAISGIIRTQFGFHIVKLTGMKKFKDIDRGHYKRLIFDEKRTKIFDRYMNKLKGKSNIKVNYKLLDKRS